MIDIYAEKKKTMDTYESILLVMIGIMVIWDKILKPLIREMWKVFYEDTQIMEQLRDNLPEEWLTIIWKEPESASDLVAQGLKEVMLHAAKKELDEKEEGLSSGRLFDRTWDLRAEDR